MRQIRQTLHLHFQAGLSYAQVGRALGVPKSTIGKVVSMARAAGVDWARAQTLTDEELEARLYRPPVPRAGGRLDPDFAVVHQELKRPGVTLMLLWEEYQRGQAEVGEPAFKYTSFCVKYRAWAARLKRSMRQIHPAGERAFVDYAGQTVEIVDGRTGEVRSAQVFVATLGASSYTYAEATWTQTLPALGRRTAPAPSETEPPKAAGSARTRGPWPFSAACRRSWSRTTRRSASIVPTGTSRG